MRVPPPAIVISADPAPCRFSPGLPTIRFMNHTHKNQIVILYSALYPLVIIRTPWSPKYIHRYHAKLVKMSADP